MSNFVLVLIVFLIGMGWGAAAMVIPIRKKMQEMTDLQLDALEAIGGMLETEKKTNILLLKFMASNDEVIASTNNVIKSVDKLIEELGNEI